MKVGCSLGELGELGPLSCELILEHRLAQAPDGPVGLTAFFVQRRGDQLLQPSDLTLKLEDPAIELVQLLLASAPPKEELHDCASGRFAQRG